jgi:DNA-binding NtrC family response regulator
MIAMDRQGPETVLVVNDDAALRELFARALMIAGYGTILCSGDAEAIDVLETREPALLMLTPGPSGFPGRDLLRMVERDSRLDDLPILICSTALHDPDRAPARPPSRAWGTIAIPFDLDVLLETVDSLAHAGARHPSDSVLEEPRLPAAPNA